MSAEKKKKKPVRTKPISTAEYEAMLTIAQGQLRATLSDINDPRMMDAHRESITEKIAKLQDQLAKHDARRARLHEIADEQRKRCREIRHAIRDIKHASKIKQLRELTAKVKALQASILSDMPDGTDPDEIERLMAELDATRLQCEAQSVESDTAIDPAELEGQNNARS